MDTEINTHLTTSFINYTYFIYGEYKKCINLEWTPVEESIQMRRVITHNNNVYNVIIENLTGNITEILGVVKFEGKWILFSLRSGLKIGVFNSKQSAMKCGDQLHSSTIYHYDCIFLGKDHMRPHNRDISINKKLETQSVPEIREIVLNHKGE